LAKIMALAAHAYVLCIECTTVRLPSTLRGKVSLLNGLDLDSYLNVGGVYDERVTIAHKFFSYHAEQERHVDAMVMEEDFLADGKVWTQEDIASFREFYNHGDFEIIRLGWNAPFVIADRQSKAMCVEACQCKLSARRLCTMSAGCVGTRSSLMYILSRSSYTKFQHLPGIIDQGMFAGLNQTLTLPALAYQSSHLKDAFPKRCLAAGIDVENCQGVDKARLELAEVNRFTKLCVT
jgi:hypothetical protein